VSNFGGYSKHYTDFSKNNGTLDPANYRFLQAGEEPEIKADNNVENDMIAMMTEGYVAIGASSFNGKMESLDNVKNQAKNIGATNVLVYSKFTNTVSGSIPITTYSPGKYVTTNNYGNFSANTYGSGGYSSNTYGNYSGTSSTYIPGSPNTNYVPYNVQRYEQTATFWIKRTSWAFGAFFQDIPDDIKKEIRSNKGAILSVVVKGTPAYDANVFVGDVVTKLNDQVIFDQKNIIDLLAQYSGQNVVFTIYRDGGYIEKSVTLGR